VPSQPSITVTDVVVAEGNKGTRALKFKVQLTARSRDPVMVNYATSDGTAVAGADYVPVAGTLEFRPRQTRKVVVVKVVGDKDVEADETLSLTLTSPTNAQILSPSATGTIRNNDRVSAAPGGKGLPAIKIKGVKVLEGDGGGTPVVFDVLLSKPSTLPVQATFTTVDRTATAGLDYTAASGAVFFDPGVTQQQVTVTVLGDLVKERNETFLVELSAPVNARLRQARARGVIRNDDRAAGA